ncbi:MAG: hypothetical protein ABSH35_37225, partial [Isosphaeraceae bacterium]
MDTMPDRWGEFREIRRSNEGIGIAAYGHPAGGPGATGVERLRPREDDPRCAAASEDERLGFWRLLAELHHSRAARIRVAGGGAGGDAPDAQASALGLPYGQPQPPKR